MIGSPNSIGTLTGLQDMLSRVGGFGQFTDLHPDRQSILNGWLELAIMEMVSERDWTFERNTSVLDARDLASAGTVSITAGLSALVGVGTTFATDLVQGDSHISFGGGSGFYLLDTIADELNATISPTLGGGANLSGETYEAAVTDYTLAADTWLLTSFREIHERGAHLQMETEANWRRRAAGVWKTGRPTHVVLLGEAGAAATTNFKIRLWPAPDQEFRYSYTYRRVPTWQTGDLREAPQALNMIVFKALQLKSLGAKEFDEATQWERQYNIAVLKASRKDVTRGEPVRHRMEPGWGGRRNDFDLQIVDDPTGTVDP